MEGIFQSILGGVLRKIVPTPEEREETQKKAELIRTRILVELQKSGLNAEVEVGGSVAKDTWLRDEVDIDIFILFLKDIDRRDLGSLGLTIARKAVVGCKCRERYAEHPYLEAWVNGTRVNIVPCYRIEDKCWLSAADRSPYHTKYIRTRLQERDVTDEIRLFKRFAKGIGVYGAEIQVGGFSGYLCELLVLSYSSFLDTLRAITRWRFGEKLGIEGLCGARVVKLKRVFQAPLVVADPVDQNRNVAAAVSEEKMSELMAASRLFLENPSMVFFYPNEEPTKLDDLRGKLASLEFDLITVILRTEEKVPDILWGELRKTERAMKRLLEANSFTVLRSGSWSDQNSISVIVFALESKRLPPSRRHLGPPGDSSEISTFLKKYRRTGLLGPYVEAGRWMTGARRRYVEASTLLREKLADGGYGIGVSKCLVGAIKSSRILIGLEAIDICTSNSEFARYLQQFTDGRPLWLIDIP